MKFFGYKTFLNESKNIGILYHYTTIESLIKILDENILGDKSLGKYATVSLTRDKNFHKRTKIIPTECCLVINGNRLSSKYKIKPYQWNSAHFSGKSSMKSGEIEDQMEEEVQGYIKDVIKYIDKVVIFEIDLDPLIFDEDFTQNVSHILNIDPEEIRSIDIVSFIESLNIPVEIK